MVETRTPAHFVRARVPISLKLDVVNETHQSNERKDMRIGLEHDEARSARPCHVKQPVNVEELHDSRKEHWVRARMTYVRESFIDRWSSRMYGNVSSA